MRKIVGDRWGETVSAAFCLAFIPMGKGRRSLCIDSSEVERIEQKAQAQQPELGMEALRLLNQKPRC